MKKTIKRITSSIAMCTLAIGLLSGCGGEFAEEMVTGKDKARPLTGSAVSGQAVSGQAVSGQAVQSDDREEGDGGSVNSRYCSEHCYYEAIFDESGKYGIEQTSLDTNKKKEFAIDGIDEVIYVEKDALYYTKEEDEGESYYSLWQLPIECHADGTEVLKTDQAEMLKGLDDIYYEMDDIYIDDEYIVYSREKEKSEQTDVTRYDRKSAEKVSMPVPKGSEKYLEYDIYEIHRYGDRLDLIMDCGVFSWDMEKGEVSVYANEDWEEESFVNMNTTTFFSGEGLYEGKGKLGITCVDVESGKMTEFVSKKEILDVLAGEVGIQEKQLQWVDVYSMYYDANCLYIQLEVEYEDEDTISSGCIMLSRNDEEGAQLKYEKGLTEYMWEEEEELEPDELEPDEDDEDAKVWKYKCGECRGIHQGVAWVMFDGDDMEESMGVYDLKAGKVKPADWKDELMLDIIFGG